MANQSLQERVATLMRGRNGTDELGTCAVALSLVLLVINALGSWRWLAVPALALALYSCWRSLSTAVAARRRENDAFLAAIGPLASWVRDPRAALREARTYRHLSCPSCRQRMRVPRGKGRMRVTCPSCHKKFDARS